MQVGSSGEMIELPQIVTGNFTSGTAQPALINPLNSKNEVFQYWLIAYPQFVLFLKAGQFYIVGATPDMLSGGTQRTIAPRGNVQVNRETVPSRTSAAGHGEPVS